jgi:hypothetical protein
MQALWHRADNDFYGNLTGIECAALSGLKADGPGRQPDPLWLILGKNPRLDAARANR